MSEGDLMAQAERAHRVARVGWFSAGAYLLGWASHVRSAIAQAVLIVVGMASIWIAERRYVNRSFGEGTEASVRVLGPRPSVDGSTPPVAVPSPDDRAGEGGS